MMYRLYTHPLLSSNSRQGNKVLWAETAFFHSAQSCVAKKRRATIAQASMGSSSPFHQGLVGTAVKLGGFIKGISYIEIAYDISLY